MHQGMFDKKTPLIEITDKDEAPFDRANTGALRIDIDGEEDKPGLFLRGDLLLDISKALTHATDTMTDAYPRLTLQKLQEYVDEALTHVKAYDEEQLAAQVAEEERIAGLQEKMKAYNEKKAAEAEAAKAETSGEEVADEQS